MSTGANVPSKRAPGARTYRQVRYERPDGATVIHLVRHGESAVHDPARPFPLLEGRGDPELAPDGRAQAEALAKRFGDLAIDAIYVTPLRRTAETAAPLVKRVGLVPIVEPDLVEVHMGEWEGGLYRLRMAARDPIALRVLERERWDAVPGAESNESLTKRTTAALARIAVDHPGGTVVAVSHAAAIAAVLAAATGSRPFAFVSVDNASVSTLVVDAERSVLRCFNDTAHLERLPGGARR